jgi:hypothetical protein
MCKGGPAKAGPTTLMASNSRPSVSAVDLVISHRHAHRTEVQNTVLTRGSHAVPCREAMRDKGPNQRFAERRRHPGFPRFNVLVGGPGSLAERSAV